MRRLGRNDALVLCEIRIKVDGLCADEVEVLIDDDRAQLFDGEFEAEKVRRCFGGHGAGVGGWVYAGGSKVSGGVRLSTCESRFASGRLVGSQEEESLWTVEKKRNPS